MASETESSCTPIWSEQLVPNGGSRRPTSECYPASPLAEAFFQDYCDSRTDSQRPERAGACLVSAEIPARRSARGSEARRTYRTPCPRRSIESGIALNKRRSGTMGSGELSPSRSETFRRPTAAKRRLLGRRWVLSFSGKWRAAGGTSHSADGDYHGKAAGPMQR